MDIRGVFEYQCFWTSGTRQGNVESNFYWFSQSDEVTTTNWDDGEPNNRFNEQCIELALRQSGFKFNDMPCENQNSVICEY